MRIGPAEVRIWSLATTTVPDPIPRIFLDVLAPCERARANAFFHVPDRRDYICAHALRRALLTDCFELPAHDWTFVSHHLLKPVVLTPIRHGRAECNITHTQGFVATVVSQDRAVGIDAEPRNRPIEAAMAPLICSPSEQAALQTIQTNSRVWQERLLNTWVRKEAFTKAVGLGLSISLSTLEFDKDGHPMLPEPVAGIGPVQDWRLWSIDTEPSYLLAVAAHARNSRVAPTYRRIHWPDLENLLRNR